MNQSAFLNTLNLTQFLNNREHVSGRTRTCCGQNGKDLQGAQNADVDTKDYVSKFPGRNWGSALPLSLSSLHPQQHDGCLRDAQFIVFIVLNLFCLLIVCCLLWFLISDCIIYLRSIRRRRCGRGDVEKGPSTNNPATGADNPQLLGYADTDNTYTSTAMYPQATKHNFSNTIQQSMGQTNPLPSFPASTSHRLQPLKWPIPGCGLADAHVLKAQTFARSCGACPEERGHAQERHRKKSSSFVLG